MLKAFYMSAFNPLKDLFIHRCSDYSAGCNLLTKSSKHSQTDSQHRQSLGEASSTATCSKTAVQDEIAHHVIPGPPLYNWATAAQRIQINLQTWDNFLGLHCRCTQETPMLQQHEAVPPEVFTFLNIIIHNAIKRHYVQLSNSVI